MKGYKWVHVNGLGQRVSWDAQDTLLEVVYSTEEYAEAPDFAAKYGHHLTFFDTEKNAREFLEKPYPNDELWEIEAEGIIDKLPPRFCVALFNTVSELEKYMRKKRPADWANWPPGTLMAKRIKLVRRIWPPEED